MNISSEIFPTDGSNSSDHFFFNGTGVETGYNMFSTLCLIPFMLGISINSYVIWLIVTGTGNGLPVEFFTLNLAVCEILFCIELFLYSFSYKFSILWIAVHFFDALATTIRPLFQCLICVERYLAVVHPVTFLKYKPLRYKVICSVFIWPIGIGSGLFYTLVFHSIYIYYTIAMLFQFLPFLSFQLFCCVAVLRALKQSGPGERGREREEENHMKRRAFYLILITTVTMVIIYGPYIVTGMLLVLLQQELSVVSDISFICFILGGFVQPVLYLHRTGKLSCFLSF